MGGRMFTGGCSTYILSFAKNSIKSCCASGLRMHANKHGEEREHARTRACRDGGRDGKKARDDDEYAGVRADELQRERQESWEEREIEKDRTILSPSEMGTATYGCLALSPASLAHTHFFSQHPQLGRPDV